MKYFTKGIDKYLANWVCKDTCLTPQDIEDNFYPFIIAIDRNSRRIKDKTRSRDDLDIADLPQKQKQRNPRTYDMGNFRKKVSLAIKRNHPDRNDQYINEEVQKLSEKALLILDALWFDSCFHRRFFRDGLDEVVQHLK